MTTNYLINEPPLVVSPTLATKIGLNEAIILQQLHYWLNGSKNERDGHKWVYNTYEEWRGQFPFWSISTIRRTIGKLEDAELIVTTSEYNKMPIDKTKWYRIDYDQLQKAVGKPSTVQNEQTDETTAQNEQPRLSKVSSPVVQSEQMSLSKMDTPITRENTDKTTEKEPDKRATAAIFALYENNIELLTPHTAECLGDLLDEYGEDWTRQAIEVSAERNARNIRYITKTLQACKAEGHPPKAPKDDSQPAAKQYKLPDWYEPPKPRPAPEFKPGEKIWQAAANMLRDRMAPETHQSRIVPLLFIELEGDTFRLGAPSPESKAWLEWRGHELILDAIREAAGEKAAGVEFVVMEKADYMERQGEAYRERHDSKPRAPRKAGEPDGRLGAAAPPTAGHNKLKETA